MSDKLAGSKRLYQPSVAEYLGLAAAGLGLMLTSFANEVGSLVGFALPLISYGFFVLFMSNPNYLVPEGKNPNPFTRAIKPAILTSISLTVLFFVIAIATLGLFAYFLGGIFGFIAVNAFWIWLIGVAVFWIFRTGQEAQKK